MPFTALGCCAYTYMVWSRCVVVGIRITIVLGVSDTLLWSCLRGRLRRIVPIIVLGCCAYMVYGPSANSSWFYLQCKVIAKILQLVDIGLNQIIVWAEPDLIITVIEDHKLEFLVDEQTGVSSWGLNSKLVHALAQMLIEQLGTVHLTIDAFVHLQHNILSG
jgi:hypothetical protein